MAAAYDNYDYPSYWSERQYEHQSEIMALKYLLSKIERLGKVVDIGAGYGRLTHTYIHRANKVVLADPSARLLKTARHTIKNKKVYFVQAKVENITKKIKSNTCDLVLFIRVIHHIEDLDTVFKMSNKLLKNNGYLILEYANKIHFKSLFKNVFSGNLTYYFDIFTKDLTKMTETKKKVLPFANYHPDLIEEKLKKYSFEIIETLSVSNVRLPFIKQHIPHSVLMEIERKTQRPLGKLRFGPSIFILAKIKK